MRRVMWRPSLKVCLVSLMATAEKGAPFTTGPEFEANSEDAKLEWKFPPARSSDSICSEFLPVGLDTCCALAAQAATDSAMTAKIIRCDHIALLFMLRYLSAFSLNY